jgi:hypothetical protein
VLHLLEALQTLKLATPGGGPAQARRLSFRALTEENIGTVYAGLADGVPPSRETLRPPAEILALKATDWLDGRRPLHWPLAFPEVFLRGEPDPSAADQAERHPVGAASSRDEAATNAPPEPKADANRGRRQLPQPPPATAKPPGFDAFIGNPSFMGGQKITGNLGTASSGRSQRTQAEARVVRDLFSQEPTT